MHKYVYTAINEDGKKMTGIIEAENVSQFKQIIKRKNEYLLKFKDDSISSATTYAKYMPKKELFFICRQFSTMLNAGINTVNCLELLYNQASNKKMKNALYSVYEGLQVGKDLSSALDVGVFPDFMINMVKSGEIGGNLAQSFERLSIQYEKDMKMKSKIISAMIYPIILLVSSILSVIVMFGLVLPKITSIIGDIGDLNILSKILFMIAEFFKNYWIIVLISTLIISVVYILYLQTDGAKYKFAKFRMQNKLIGGLYTNMVAGVFTRTLSTLFLNGVPLVLAIEMTALVINNRYVYKHLKVVIEDITKGMTFSNALVKSDIFPYSVTSIIHVGEETGSLEEVLIKTTGYYDMIVDDSIEKIISVIEPIMIIIFGIIVIIILVGAFVPIYDMYNNIMNI